MLLFVFVLLLWVDTTTGLTAIAAAAAAGTAEARRGGGSSPTTVADDFQLIHGVLPRGNNDNALGAL